MSKLNPMKFGASVLDMVTNDQEAEIGAVRACDDAIALAHEVSDQASSNLLLRMLKMEEGGHVDSAEVHAIARNRSRWV